MRLAAIPTTLGLVSALTGCAGWNGTGLRADPLPAAVTAHCPKPEALLSRGGTIADDFVSQRRLGDALIDCAAAKDAAVEAYERLRGAIEG